MRSLWAVASQCVRLCAGEKAGEKPSLGQPGPAPGRLSCYWHLEGIYWMVTSSKVQLEAPLPPYQPGLSLPAAREFWFWPVSYCCLTP